MRVVFKVSGEALGNGQDSLDLWNFYKTSGEALGNGQDSLDIWKFYKISCCIKKLHDAGIEVAIVPGGGNIWRGRNGSDIKKITSDMIGMASTLVNAYTLSALLNSLNIDTQLVSGLSNEKLKDYNILNKDLLSKVHKNAEIIRILSKISIIDYNPLKASDHLSNNQVVIIGGGIGVSGFTTDMTVILSAIDLDADFILFGKSALGVYDMDPRIYGDQAELLSEVTHNDILNNQMKVGLGSMGIMDAPAMIKLCENPITTLVFNIWDFKTIDKVIEELIKYYHCKIPEINDIEGTVIKTEDKPKIKTIA